MNVLVLGASGMAGHVIATHLRESGHKVYTVVGKRRFDKDSIQLDATDLEAVSEVLRSNDFDVVVNCIGMLVKESEERKVTAIQINSLLPHYLERHYQDTNTRVIHLSTDCVFSGYGGPYKEKDVPDGELFYDRTKSLGEIVNEKDLTFRMSIIGPDMQPDGSGLFNWFFGQSGEINGFTNAIWNGITTIQLAKSIEYAIGNKKLTGLYHLVPNTNISKYDLLGLFKDVFDRSDISIKKDDRDAPDKTLINTRSDVVFDIPNYHDMIQEMKEWVSDHPDLYPQYIAKMKELAHEQA